LPTAEKEAPRKTEPAPPKPEKKKESTLEFIASIAVVLVVGLFIITFNLQAFEIPSSSMENTLLIGDHVFVDRVSFAPKTPWLGHLEPYRAPKRGDIVVFLSLTEPGMYIVKRIIGVPGDRIHLREGEVYRNGQKLDEPYVFHCARERKCEYAAHEPYRDNFPAVPGDVYNLAPEWRASMRNYIQGDDVVVPEGRYFAMGDNRDASYDSRYWGFIPKENIIGRPMFIYWSFETPADQVEKTALSQRVAFIGHVVLHFFGETRWNRTFHMVR
jgi:signal peptidase I